MIKKKGALFLAMLLLSIYALPTMTEAKDRVSLKADTIRYAENNRIMIAKDNVHLSVGDTRITADRLRLDTVNNMAWASGNLTISQGEDTFYSAYAMIDLEKNTVQLEDVKLAMTPPGSAQKIYFSAHKLVDHDAHKSGTFGTVSTCEHDPPHYFMWAQHFDYHNKELIVAYNVLFYNPILFVPFGIWTPVYIYDISKRRVILNFPKIGRKEQPGWGWFVQSTIDYDSLYGKDSSVFFDWFENKGIGAGIKHQYEVGKNIGTLSYYNFDFDDNGQKKANRKMGWNNNFELDERLSINTIFDKIETDERINRSGSHKTENKSVQLNYDDLGDKYNVNIKENEDFNQSYKNFELSTKHMYNHEKRYDFNYSKNTNYIRQQENVIANGSHTLHLPDSTKLENRLRYRGDETWSDDEDRDEDLKTYSSFTRKISKNIDMRIDIDMFFDLEGNKVTTDEFSNKNDFLYKVPEINFKYTNIDLGPFIIEEDITIGRYKEVQYNSQFKTQRVFPDPDDFGFEPNAYIFKQTIRKTFDQLPLKSSFTAKTSHHQYIFKSPGHTLLNGDALNTFNLELKQSSDILSFLKME
ncbi:MAG: lipopolysaccharide export system protein LptA, partial [Candidatus Marinamargulisbacteria bacterium]